MNCVSPSCAGVIPDGGVQCAVCGLRQRAHDGMIEVVDPAVVTYVAFPDERTVTAGRVVVWEHTATLFGLARTANVVLRRRDLVDIVRYEPPNAFATGETAAIANAYR